MNQIIKITVLFLLCLTTVTGWGQSKPFPQAVSWPGVIKPNHVTQATLNSDVIAYYNYWKGAHLKQSTVNAQRYYVKANSTGGSAEAITNSEAHGYGMLITALMAGYDANAKTYYDGLYRMYDTHRSVNNSNLMQWQVFPDERSRSIGSATDGDMDIAYSLLLAHAQWGSTGAINYLDAAQKMITNGLKASYISTALRLRLSDDGGNDQLSTRPSDWMFDHMHAFKNHTNDVVWDNLANNLYSVFNQVVTSYAPNTGLISDFVMYNPPQPAPPYQPQADEGPTTGKYYYNACRVPLRVVMDYAQYGTASAKTIANRIATWSKNATGGNPANIRAGYELNGTALSGSNYQTAVFIAPIVAAATSDAAHQQFLNQGWNVIKNMHEGYFEDTYNMLCLLYISGNWWKPEAGVADPCVPAAASADDGNVAANVLDNDLNTRWSADGDGQWIQFCLGTPATVNGVQIAFYSGNTRTSRFDVLVSPDASAWTTAAPNLTSSGTSLALQTFSFTPVTAKYVRIVGHGNSVNTWNSYTEVKINAGTPALPNLALNKTVAVSSIEATGFEGAGAVDGNATTTRWASLEGVDPQWIYVDLGATYNINRVKITWEAAYARDYTVQLSADGQNWGTPIKTVTGNTALVNDHTGLTGSGRYVRIHGTARGTTYGYSIYELEVYGSASAAAKTAATFSPNPATNTVSVSVPESLRAGAIEVVDQSGAILMRESVKEAVQTLDISTLPKGTYFMRIRVRHGEGSSVQRIVKE
jgi:endo-1,4-beta-D-glucanase Y